jgi:DNA-binding beta-propeller fold protein YncE
MNSEIGKVSFDELNHFVGVFHQMGRLPLESDFNEQNELVLRMIQRLAGNAVHTGSPNDGFRIDTHVLIDRMENKRGWTSTPATAAVFVDYIDHRVGDGSLVSRGASAIAKRPEKPLDLSGVGEVLFAVKADSVVGLGFYLKDASATHAFTLSVVAAAANDWTLMRAVPGVWPAGFAQNAVVEYGFTGLVSGPTKRYAFDFIKADLPLRTVIVRTDLGDRYSVLPATAQLVNDDDQRIWSGKSLQTTQATSVTYVFPEPIDASRARRLLVAVQRTPSAAPLSIVLKDDATVANSITLSGAVITTVGAWAIHAFSAPQVGTFNWSGITSLTYSGLSAAATYRFGPVLLEADPARDLVVMGGDGTAEGAGRFYADGMQAVRERHGTYWTQRDLPSPDPAALAPVAAGNRRIDCAYLDIWERPIGYIEHPDLREVALDGIDTCTRTQLMAQVRLIKGAEVAFASAVQAPNAVFAGLRGIGSGVLTTKDKPAATIDPCADPCEPKIEGPYLGESNRLFRIEIHAAGNVGAALAATTARFKWSRENATAATGLIEDALAATTSALVEKPEIYAIGDLIELSDDLIEKVTGAYEDRVGHSHHLRGELRKITTINLQTRRISWEDPSVVDPLEVPFHAALPRTLRIAQHAKIVRWDAVGACVPGDIVLADGVVIEFGGSDLRPGDYWLFTTRAIDRSVESLIEAPARGIRHHYYPLSAIHRARVDAASPELVFCEDQRPRFASLTELDASRIAYDSGACATYTDIPGWDKVGTVQEAIDALCMADLTGDMRLHNRLLHGMGVICGLKLRCNKNRKRITLTKGYALDCDGDLLHLSGDRLFELVDRATDQNLISGGKGKVNLWIEKAATGVSVHLEPHVTQGFWDSVLEGSLLKDFWDNCIASLIESLKKLVLPFPGTTLPLSDEHKRMISLLNLLWQVINSASGPYVFVSKVEHDLLKTLYEEIRDLLASKTYCAMFDHLQQFPAYPFSEPTGIETMFGMFLMHTKMKIDPSGRYLYTYGRGHRIQIYDVNSNSVVAVLEFPGGNNLELQDIAFNEDGSRVYAVGSITKSTGVDSVFATAFVTAVATAGAAPTATWGASTIVCDIQFVRLDTHRAHASTLFAVGRSDTSAKRGLYRFNPMAIPLVPSPVWTFNAIGLLAIDTDGANAIAVSNSGNTPITDQVFNGVQRIVLGTPTSLGAQVPVGGGNLLANDLVAVDGTAYLTIETGAQSVLLHFPTTITSLAQSQPTVLPSQSVYRLSAMPATNTLIVADMNTYRAQRFNTGTNTLLTTARIPLQVMPVSLATSPSQNVFYTLNLITNTVSAVNLDRVVSTAPPFTMEPPVILADYRQEMLHAYTDLIGVFGQYLKDCFCDKFLIECHECTEDDKVYLGTIEIKNNQVFHICNFSKRHYAKTFKTWGYWLSAVPLIPLIKRGFAQIACLKMIP